MLPGGSAISARPQKPRRVAFYSHDTVGLGHTRRNLALAAALVASGEATDVLLITGNPKAGALPLPASTDIVTLPTVTKSPTGGYQSRVLHSPLPVVVHIRSKVIEAALTAFEPDLLVVDKVPLGVADELRPALTRLKRNGRTRVVLGLREILDEPVAAIREWKSMGTSQAIADFYHEVWVYGDRAVYDLVVEYGLPCEVASKIVYTGYLSRGRAEGIGTRPDGARRPPKDPYVLCQVGGGQDGFELANTFAQTPMPAGHRGIVLTGPFMNPTARQQLLRTIKANPAVRVYNFVANAEEFLVAAAAVVSMVGYNSACEILATPTPALLVPRTQPRAEQLVRARCLADRRLADMIEVERLDSVVLHQWLVGAVADCHHGAARASTNVNLSGLDAVPDLVALLIDGADNAA